MHNKAENKVNWVGHVAWISFRSRSHEFVFVRKGFRMSKFALDNKPSKGYVLHYKSVHERYFVTENFI
jgi:hypothetical protein